MSGRTSIEWTQATWNPVVGCTQVSPGCAHCYAKTLHDRRHKAYLAGKKIAPQYAHPFETVQLIPERLSDPLSRRAPTTYFVNSVSDLFHQDVPKEFLMRVFAVMKEASRHTFQILTKRPERIYDNLPDDWFEGYPNVWLGVSVENQRFAYRASVLCAVPARVRFVSAEPLLGPLSLSVISPNADADGWELHHDALIGATFTRYTKREAFVARQRTKRIDWVIVGGESGDGARPMNLDWARSLRDECAAAGTAFFLKQIGGATDKQGHEKAILDGMRHLEMPRVA